MKPVKNWDDNGVLRVPPAIPQVDASRVVLIYDDKGNPITQETGFRGETKK